MIRIFDQYVSVKRLLLMALEGILVAVALICGAWLRFFDSPQEFQAYVKLPDFGFQTLFVVLVFQISFYYAEYYRSDGFRSRLEQFLCLGQAVGGACFFLGVVYYLFPGLLIGRGVFFISTFLAVALVAVNRVVLDRTWHVAASRERVLVMGTGDLAHTVARELKRRGDLSVEFVGFYDPTDKGVEGEEPPPSLEAVALETAATRIVVAMEDRRGVLPVRQLVTLRVQGVKVQDAHTVIAELSGRVWLKTIQPSWFVFSEGFHRSRLTLGLKRAGDLVFAVVGLIIALPLMLLVALAVKLDSKGPILYRQERVGYRRRRFEVLKFRSMRTDAETNNQAQWAQQNDPRVTRIGGFLRTYRLDELPQFINVIRGDMSFVGPRPERPVFVDMLRKEISYYDERHSARPGLTGWAQVRYSYGATVEDSYRKLEYDLFYLKNMSLLFDCAIILETVRTVLTGRGAR
jgi:sugar transferase (PEP-CTERM system associated)